MKKHSMPEMKEGGVNVTPLIDIVMCLIIFFMLVAKIGVTRGVDTHITLPEAILGVKITELGSTLTLNLHAGAGLQVTTLVNDKEKTLTTTKGGELEVVLKAFKTAHINPATGVSNAMVIVRADEEVTFDQFEPVLEAITQAGIIDKAYEVTQVHTYKKEKE